MNTDILYLYGLGRSVETRRERRGSFPREQQVRMGPWIVRPTRRVAVRKDDLAKHRTELVMKVTNGTVQLQQQDGTVVLLQDFDALFGTTKTDFSSMSMGELYELLRGEAPTVDMLRAYIFLVPVEERRGIAAGLRSIVETLNISDPDGLMKLTQELNDAQQDYEAQLENEKREQINKEAAEAEARAKAEQEAAAEKEAEEKAKTPPAPTSPVVTAPKVDAEDDMDFSKPETKTEESAPESTTVVTETTPSTPTETVESPKPEETPVVETPAPAETAITEAPPATETTDSSDEVSSETTEEMAAADAKKVAGRELPEGWRNLSNANLLSLITKVGAVIPDKKNKDQLTKALETWLAGGS